VADIASLVEAVPDDVLIIIDEAYNEFVSAADSQDALRIQAEHDNVVVLRTFSKIYGLCGLRVGYGLCRPDVARAVDKLRQPFNVNRLAQAAALAALPLQDQVAERRDENAHLREYLVERLAERGRAIVPSEANFMLVDTRGLRHPHEEVPRALLELGAIVRDGNALGCPGWVRVSVGTPAEIDFFLERMASLEIGVPDADERGAS
jgi:histidinol-phosphate aminotransferase